MQTHETLEVFVNIYSNVGLVEDKTPHGSRIRMLQVKTPAFQSSVECLKRNHDYNRCFFKYDYASST